MKTEPQIRILGLIGQLIPDTQGPDSSSASIPVPDCTSPFLQSPGSFSKLSHTSHFLHSFSSLRPLRPGLRGQQLGLLRAKLAAPLNGMLRSGGRSQYAHGAIRSTLHTRRPASPHLQKPSISQVLALPRSTPSPTQESPFHVPSFGLPCDP